MKEDWVTRTCFRTPTKGNTPVVVPEGGTVGTLALLNTLLGALRGGIVTGHHTVHTTGLVHHTAFTLWGICISDLAIVTS